jgi:predicted nucleotidyltransferase
MTVGTETLATFRATLRRRQAEEEAARTARRERAWAAARRGATLLREHFGAQRVVVFGSLVEDDGAYFDALSDLDLAAWHIDPGEYFLAVARMQTVSDEFGLDLVAVEACPGYLRPAIEERGVDL